MEAKTTVLERETIHSELLFPFLDLKAQHAEVRDQVMSRVQDVLDDQRCILGAEVAQLERELAEYLECKFAIGCASGSDALLLALMALGVGPGDEVITTPFTFVATAGSIARLGAKPVFVDIDPVTYNIEPEQIEAAITPRTRAIIPVHLFGLPADMTAISEISRRHNLAVIEDAAQAISARFHDKPVGSFGIMGCFSFFPSKNLGCAGDGGLIVTNNPETAAQLKQFRVHGSNKKYFYQTIGMNSRLDTLQAAILLAKLPHLDSWTAGRHENADRYALMFEQYGLASHVSLPVTSSGCVHAFNQFVIRTGQRDELKNYLRQHGVPTEIYYPSPLHVQPAFTYLGYRDGDFPVSEQAAKEVLALPIYPELTPEQQEIVVRTASDFFHNS